MADLYFTYCAKCGDQIDCLVHEGGYLCVGARGCYRKVTEAQDALRRERLEKCEREIRASQDGLRLAPASDSRNLTNKQKLDHPLNPLNK